MRSVVPQASSRPSAPVDFDDWVSHINLAESVAELNGDWLWLIDREAQVVHLSDRVPVSYRDGLLKSLRQYVSFCNALATEDAPASNATIQPFYDKQTLIETGTGDVCCARFSGTPIFSAQAKFEGLMGTVSLLEQHSRAELPTLELYKQLIQGFNLPVMLFDARFIVLEANPSVAKLLACNVGELIGATEQQFSLEQQRFDRVYPDEISTLVAHGHCCFQWPVLTANGDVINVNISLAKIELGSGGVYIATLQDISQIRQIEKLQSQVLAIFENSAEGMMIAAPDRRIEAINPAFTAITGYVAADVVGQTPAVLRSGKHDASFYRNMWERIDLTGHWNGEIWNRRKDGEVYAEWLSINAVKDDQGKVLNYIGTFSDITEIRRTAEEIEYLSHYDRVTGLQNVTLMRVQMQQQLISCKAQGGLVCVFCLNLDGFRRVISSYGYEGGDKLLSAVATFLVELMPPEANICRLSADSFAVAIRVDNLDGLRAYVDKIQTGLRNGVVVENMDSLSLSCCCGVTLFPDDATDPSELLRNAESAMRTAKSSGRGSFAYYQPQMISDAAENFALEQEINKALHNDEFELHFQPKVEIGTARIVGAEALIRWRQPDGSYTPPGKFMPVVESSDLVDPINRWVIDQAVQTLSQWLDQGIVSLSISINISSATLLTGKLASYIGQALNLESVPAEMLEIEILENVFFEHPEVALAEIQKIRNFGVTVSLDDFGTGFSSLSYLQRFSIDYLKIDRSFISSLTSSSQSLNIVRSTIAMAHNMGISTVAEGIETDEQLGKLVSLGCDMLQGYRIAKPMPKVAFEAFYKNNQNGFDKGLHTLLSHSVLIVDDSDEMRFILRTQLEELGWNVIEAATGQAGLDVLAGRHVEAVVSDYVMPNMDGIAFLSQVKQQFPDVKRIIVSAKKDQQMVINAVNKAGISGFLTKPWSEEELLLTLNS